MPKASDLTGRVFGRYTVLGPAESTADSRGWRQSRTYRCWQSMIGVTAAGTTSSTVRSRLDSGSSTSEAVFGATPTPGFRTNAIDLARQWARRMKERRGK